MDTIKITYMKEDQAEQVMDLVIELAAYEKMEDQIQMTANSLKNLVFNEKIARVLVAEYEGKLVSYALFFFNVSTFKGRKGLYLEDLYVSADCRGLGVGKKMFSELAKIARDENCGRMEWACLDWNTTSQQFYLNRGAQKMNEWDSFRVDESGFDKLIVDSDD